MRIFGLSDNNSTYQELFIVDLHGKNGVQRYHFRNGAQNPLTWKMYHRRNCIFLIVTLPWWSVNAFIPHYEFLKGGFMRERHIPQWVLSSVFVLLGSGQTLGLMAGITHVSLCKFARF